MGNFRPGRANARHARDAGPAESGLPHSHSGGSTEGGSFEYVPMLRGADDPNPEGIRALLSGDRSGVRTFAPEPGTLALFRGLLSPHRVTPIAGGRPRINAVLSYATEPDAVLTPSARRTLFGRE